MLFRSAGHLFPSLPGQGSAAGGPAQPVPESGAADRRKFLNFPPLYAILLVGNKRMNLISECHISVTEKMEMPETLILSGFRLKCPLFELAKFCLTMHVI